MRMLVSVEFADAGTKSGTHRVLTIGRAAEDQRAGDIGLSLEEAKTLISSIQDEFVAAQAAEIVESGGNAVAERSWASRIGSCVAFTQHSAGSTCRALA